MENKIASEASGKSWTARVQEKIGPKGFVKFGNGTEWTMRFLNEPYDRTFNINGKDAISFEFGVAVNGEEKTMSVRSKRLMNKLILEDKNEPLIGRTLRIKAIGDGVARDWKVESLR